MKCITMTGSALVAALVWLIPLPSEALGSMPGIGQVDHVDDHIIFARGRGGGGGVRAGGMHRGGGVYRAGGVHRAAGVNRNVNVNRNINRNVNVNRGVYRGGNVYYRGGAWRRPGSYWWPAGGAIAAGAAIGVVGAATAAAWAGSAPGPNYCWYYTDSTKRKGFWDPCQ
ncbi:hypothetical protein [Rhodoblastus sp.]|uniref:hypothetical protein n=1 Tax=Rhodoblastus sp. TaxID=1962975 RepID=UPI0035B414A8